MKEVNVVLLYRRRHYTVNQNGAEPQGGTTQLPSKRQDALQAFIRKCLLFSRRSSAPVLNLTKEDY